MKKTLFIGAAATLFAGAALAHPGGPGGPGMRADANGDGNLTLAEINAEIDEHFARIDANGDGAVDQAEREAMHERMRARHAERQAEREADGEGHRRHHGRPGHRGGERMMERMDADGDGLITRDEIGARATEHFRQADTDNDGVLTAAEREAAHQAMRERHRNQGS